MSDELDGAEMTRDYKLGYEYGKAEAYHELGEEYMPEGYVHIHARLWEDTKAELQKIMIDRDYFAALWFKAIGEPDNPDALALAPTYAELCDRWRSVPWIDIEECCGNDYPQGDAYKNVREWLAANEPEP